jgi:hypothetical protein
MKSLLSILVGVILGLSMAFPARAQRRQDNDNERSDRSSFDEDRRSRRERSDEQRSNRNSWDEQRERNSFNSERGNRSSSDEQRTSGSSSEDRGSRWQRWGGGSDGGASFSRSTRSESRGGGSVGGVFAEQYSIITERNIFLRDRRSRETQQDWRSRTTAPRTPEQTYVLTGVVFEDDEFHAFMEDVTRRTIQKLTVGTPIARGRIAAIDIDAVAYESNGQVTWVNVGSNLTGTSVGSVSEERVNAALFGGAGAAAPGAPLPDANNPNLTVEERMRLRRAMETTPGAALPPVPEAGSAEQPPDEGGEQLQVEQPAGVEQPDPNQPAPQPPQGADTSGLSLEEQMRLRRQQELGR